MKPTHDTVYILYEDGESETVNLNKVRWQVAKDQDLAHMVANMNIVQDQELFLNLDNYDVNKADRLYYIDPSKLKQVKNTLRTEAPISQKACPQTFKDIMRMPEEQKEAWRKANDKEFNAILEKGALKIVDEKSIPRDAIFVPSKWAFRIKPCGTLKSRLCVLGNLMPKDDMDLTCPTPRLSTVRMMMAHAIKNDLEFDVYDVNSAGY